MTDIRPGHDYWVKHMDGSTCFLCRVTWIRPETVCVSLFHETYCRFDGRRVYARADLDFIDEAQDGDTAGYTKGCE